MVAAEITPVAEEQELIEALSDEFRPFHRPDLPYHNFSHSRDDVLPEILRLDTECHPEGNPGERRLLIASALGHETLWHLELDPEEGLSSREDRSAAVVAQRLPKFGFTAPEVALVRGLIAVTEPGTHVKTEAEIKMRRADLKNVASKNKTDFIAGTVKLFYEALMLCREKGKAAPRWTSYVLAQQGVLRSFLEDDLSLPSDGRPGVFNRAANKNTEWLSSSSVLDPARFIRRQGRYLKSRLPMLHESDLRG